MPRFVNLARARKPMKPRRLAQRIWSAMRQRRRFTMGDLAAIAECEFETLRGILYPWRRAGIVHIDNDGFRLARDLGPQPPFHLGSVSGLVDRLTGEVMPFRNLPRPQAKKPRKRSAR